MDLGHGASGLALGAAQFKLAQRDETSEIRNASRLAPQNKAQQILIFFLGHAETDDSRASPKHGHFFLPAFLQGSGLCEQLDLRDSGREVTHGGHRFNFARRQEQEF
jgi:hypothetical protein